MAPFCAEDAIAYPPSEPAAFGRAAAKKVRAAYLADLTFVISWKTTHAQVTGDFGSTSGTYEDSFRGPDGMTVSEKGKYLCVWQKQKEGRWKAVHDKWNTDSKQAPRSARVPPRESSGALMGNWNRYHAESPHLLSSATPGVRQGTAGNL